MYIGPWQEYRLAKIQDDVRQRLRHDCDAQFQGKVPSEDDGRIRELIQPFVARFPPLIVSAKARSGSNIEVRNRHCVRSHGSLTSGSTNRCSSRPVSAVSSTSSALLRTGSGNAKNTDVQYRHTNQSSHELIQARTPRKPPRSKKTGKKAPLTALEQVQKRKKMFAMWIKQAGNGNNDAQRDETQSGVPKAKEDMTPRTRLPPIHSVASVCAELRVPKVLYLSALPTPNRRGITTDASMDQELSHQTTSLPYSISASNPAAAVDLDESVDEEEVNNLLNWTDTLLSPQALDSPCDFFDV